MAERRPQGKYPQRVECPRPGLTQVLVGIEDGFSGDEDRSDKQGEVGIWACAVAAAREDADDEHEDLRPGLGARVQHFRREQDHGHCQQYGQRPGAAPKQSTARGHGYQREDAPLPRHPGAAYPDLVLRPDQ
jgi:hypothetical protein